MKTPYDDVMVISIVVVNFKVHKIIVDNGNTIDVLFYDTFERMKLSRVKLASIPFLLYGFNREVMILEEVYSFTYDFSTTPRHLNLMVNFLIAKVLFADNIILGHPYMKMTKTYSPLIIL